MNIRLFCRWERPTPDGRVPIMFKVKNDKFLTGEYLPPGKKQRDAWDQKAQSVNPRFSGADQINKRLTKKKAVFISILETQKEFDPQKVRALFERYLENPDGFNMATDEGKDAGVGEFYAIIESIIEDHRNKWSKGYIKRFKSIRTKFLDFDPEFTPEKLSVQWWRDFVNHCVEELGNVNNTIQTDAKIIQRLIDELKERGYKLSPGLDEITWNYIEPEINSIPWDKVIALSKLDLTDHHKATYDDSRILWVLGALTGRRWGEIEKMDEKNFYKDSAGRWRYKSTGKGLKAVDLPLLPEAVAFLKKIKFKIPRRAQQVVNRDIKQICRIAKDEKGKFLFHDTVLHTTIKGKKVEETLVQEWETIHIHTGRHSYAEHIVDLSSGEPHAEKFVSFMLGHASFATTWKYINRRKSSNLQMFDKIIHAKALQK